MRFYVIDKRTGKEPIFDGNHIFRESWCKGRLIERDIDGWYISEDGQLALVDDCCNMAYPPPDRFEIVYDALTVCDIEQIMDEIEKVKAIMNEEIINHDRKDLINFVNGLNQSLVIIDKYRG